MSPLPASLSECVCVTTTRLSGFIKDIVRSCSTNVVGTQCRYIHYGDLTYFREHVPNTPPKSVEKTLKFNVG